jgi:hydrophobe/amphiphile efflux-1 (HAE1) family protein
LSRFFIERPIFAIVLAIVVLVIGLLSAFSLPVAQYPQITPPQATVSATYVGANAQVVEQTIAQLIELQVNGVENMISMLSTSSDTGTYSLNVKFDLGTNGDIDAVGTQNRVAQANASLPMSVVQYGITTKKVSPDMGMVFALYSPNSSYDDIFLKNYGDLNLVEDLKRVKGVGDITEFGTDFGMRIWLKPDIMAQLGLTVTDVSNAINEQNMQAPAGTIGQQPAPADQQFQYTARVQGRLTEPEEFKKIILRSNPDGTLVRIEDVADVSLGGRSYSSDSEVNGAPAASFAIRLMPDANILETVSECERIIAEASKKFPADLQYKVVVDTTQFVRESMKEVAITFGEAMLLVLLVVFLFLQSWRATLIPMLAVPISLIGTFGAFLALNFTINTLTLFAMVLAIGLVVDDAIVVIEAVEHHIRFTGLSPHDATIRAMDEVAGPVIAIAFVLAAVFIPVAFYGGTTGVLYKQFALTIAVSMALSALVAISLTPALCALILKPNQPNAHNGLLEKFFAKFNNWFEQMVERYGHGLTRLLKRTVLGIAFLGVLLVCTFGLYRLVPSSYIPSEDLGYYVATVSLPEAASMNRTHDAGSKIAAFAAAQPGVDSTMLIDGYDILAGASKSNMALVYIRLKPWDERKAVNLQVDNQIVSTMRESSHLPEATTLAFDPPALPGIGSTGGFSMMLEDRGGNSEDEIDRVSKAFVAAAHQRPELGTVYSNFRIDTPSYEYVVDREKTKTLGIAIDDVYNALQVFLGGREVNNFNSFGRTYVVNIQAQPQFRNNVDDIRYFFVRTATGTMVPLNTLVKSKQTTGPSVIQRFNGYRAIQIGGNQAPGYSSGQALQALQEVAAQTLPSSFSYEWTDQSREEKLSGGRAPIIFGFSLFFVFLCLAALYESWSVPLAILLSVPTGIFGAFFFQYMCRLQNNLYMQIGLIMLIGLAAKNAILIVEFAKVRVDKGMDLVTAAIEAAKLRLRPIIMTSLAFIIGCIPLAIASGAGAGARNAMGTAVVGGMLMATSIGIFLIPVLFVFVEQWIIEKFSQRK